MEAQRLVLKELIGREVFVTKDRERIMRPNGSEANWLFDFRRVLFQPDTLRIMSDLFYNEFEDEYPFQIGGMEVAGIPLVTAFVLDVSERRGTANGFFIRKSRKKTGLLRMIEGTVTDEKIILVDDLINTGKSFIRQVEVLESLGKKVSAVFAILRFRDESYYTYFHEHGIRVVSLFELSDFSDSLAVHNLVDRSEPPVPMPFVQQWRWGAPNPDYFKVIPKSAPVLDETRVYFGTDNGSFWALNQMDGSIAWEYKTLFGSREKKAFSSPVLHENAVYVGASDGNFYALDTKTGKRKWVYLEADWIQSSPCIAEDLELVFVGLEFGLWNKKGGLVALDTETGTKKWEQRVSRAMYSSPAYSKKCGVVVSSCDEHSACGFDAGTGKLLWSFVTEDGIKESFAFYERSALVCFGSFDSYLYVLETKTGKMVRKIKTSEAIYSTPLVHDHVVYVASLDKNLYCIDLDTGTIVWKFATRGRIFASPEIVGDRVYIGSNDGRLYELDAVTGKNTALFQATERITNKVACNKNTGSIFLPTFANEMYCLKRDGEVPSTNRRAD